MKKGYTGRLAAVAVVLCLVTMSLTSGTLAKYTSSADGSATATVAKWAVKFTDGAANDPEEYVGTGSIVLPLKDSVQEGKDLVAEGLVAPETTGMFTLEVDGTGTEVAFDYFVQIDMSGDALRDAPIKFYSDDTYENELGETSAGSKVYELKGRVMANAEASAQKIPYSVYWKWVTTSDEADTALGKKSAADNPLTYTIPVTMTATQVTSLG